MTTWLEEGRYEAAIVELDVYDSNPGGGAFWQRLGFVPYSRLMQCPADHGTRPQHDAVSSQRGRIGRSRVIVNATGIGLATLGCLCACGPPEAHDDAAVWQVGPGQQLSPNSTGFTAIVSRAGCSSGQQGEPEAPVIHADESTIAVTFRIEPHISGGTCQGTPGVEYRVHLGEPIGGRALVDGECHPRSSADSTAFCLQDGMRLKWRHGQPRLYAMP